MCSQVGQEPSNEVMPDKFGAFASRSDQLPRPAPPVGVARDRIRPPPAYLRPGNASVARDL